MEILKFGGTSLGNAERILVVLDIVLQRSKESRIGVVVSAIKGVTNYLDESINSVLDGAEAGALVAAFRAKHEDIIIKLSEAKSKFDKGAFIKYLDEVCDVYESLLRGIQLFKTYASSIYPHILSFGERLTARMMYELILSECNSVQLLEATQYIKTDGNAKEGFPVIAEITKRFQGLCDSSTRILLLPGFFGSSHSSNEITLLGRNGSDLSAALMAVGLKAKLCEIWTDVDGICTADPNISKLGLIKPIAEVSYVEASELSKYGAKVIHPKTVTQLAKLNIPLVIKNTFNPTVAGTKIYANAERTLNVVRAISCMANIALLEIRYCVTNVGNDSDITDTHNITGSIYREISDIGIFFIPTIVDDLDATVRQSSAHFCVQGKDVALVQELLTKKFMYASRKNKNNDNENMWGVNKIITQTNLAIISAIGTSINIGDAVSNKLLTVLENAKIAPIGIVDGASLNSVAVVINENYTERAVHVLHLSFFGNTSG